LEAEEDGEALEVVEAAVVERSGANQASSVVQTLW
jgi:hypothetical protein